MLEPWSPIEITGWVTLIVVISGLIWRVVRWGLRVERSVIKTEAQTNGALDSKFAAEDLAINELGVAISDLTSTVHGQGLQLARITGELTSISNMLGGHK